MSNLKNTPANIANKYPIFRLWCANTFKPIVSWTIFVDHHYGTAYSNPMVRRVNGSKFTSLPQNLSKHADEDVSHGKVIRVDEAFLEPHEFEALNLFQNFLIQTMSENQNFRDGTFYGVQTYSTISTLILEWWEEGPESWTALTTWARQTMSYLSALIDKQSEK
jgi:hypothetical protein